MPSKESPELKVGDEVIVRGTVAEVDTDDDGTWVKVSLLGQSGTLEFGSNYVQREPLLDEAIREARLAALEHAAQIADEHWPESGHVHQATAVSCQMSISIAIRKAKNVTEWEPTEHEKEVERIARESEAAWWQATILICGEGLKERCEKRLAQLREGKT